MASTALRPRPESRLTVMPIGLWVFALACELVYRFAVHSHFWLQVAFYAIGAGVGGAVVAGLLSLRHVLAATDGRARRINVAQLGLGGVVVLMFAVNLWLRTVAGPDDLLPPGLSLLGLLVIAVTGARAHWRRSA
jgi:uncharacterized membrane protein